MHADVKSSIIVAFLCSSQSKTPPPSSNPGKRRGLGQKNSKKLSGPHSNVLASPRLPVKVYAEVPIFIWWKSFKPVWFSIFYCLILIIIIWNKGKYKSSWFQKFWATKYKIMNFLKKFIKNTKTDNKVTLNHFISSFKFNLDSSSIICNTQF